MRVMSGAVLVAASFGVSAAEQPVSSADAMAIARGNACMGCHAIDRKPWGHRFSRSPRSTRAMRRRAPGSTRRSRTAARASGARFRCRPHPKMTDADIRTVVAWVLAGAPQK
ncbi:Cytochrome c551/c552 [Candidatus Paraburkholderia kirkii]|nr:Cytochrome c551/c552 [Candidatus Paraburkholderia kirkii]